MIWIAPTEKDADNAPLEKRLWDAADQFRANSGLKSQEHSGPVRGLIFLRFAKVRSSAIVAPSFRLIQNLRPQIQNPRRMCDQLLPRLLSGQINLKEN